MAALMAIGSSQIQADERNSYDQLKDCYFGPASCKVTFNFQQCKPMVPVTDAVTKSAERILEANLTNWQPYHLMGEDKINHDIILTNHFRYFINFDADPVWATESIVASETGDIYIVFHTDSTKYLLSKCTPNAFSIYQQE
ncbi:hypothetical protein [Parendozoicomonas haliclonae]